MPHRDPWQEVPDPQGTRFVLAARALPHLKKVGLGVILVGLVFDAIVLGATSPVWWPVLRGLSSGGPPGPDAALLAIPVLAVAGMIVPVWLGCLIGFGHAELLITATHAIGIDRCGPFRYRRRILLADITGLVVDLTPVEVNDKPVREGPWGDVGALMAEGGRAGTKPSALVIGYPRSVLAALGERVRDRAGLAGAGVGGGGRGEPIAITVREEHADDETDTPAQPAGSTAVIERTPEGISISLSPMGFFKGSKGLGCFSILWLGFVSIFASVSVGMVVGGTPVLQALPFLGISTLFGAIGAGMFFAAVRSGKRRAVIDVVGEDLLITRQSTGAARTQSWHRSEIDRVVVGKSGMEVNDVPVMELQIWPTGGRKVGLFAERDDAELRWIAGEIRAALRTPGGSGHAAPRPESGPAGSGDL